MKTWGLVALLMLASARAEASSITAEILRIANAYGFSQWDSVKGLRFTFHLQQGTTTVERSWEWDIKNDQVALESAGEMGMQRILFSPLTSSSDEIAIQQQARIWFRHDKAWLLLPLQMAWDNEAVIALGGERGLPIGKGRASRCVVSYPRESESPFAGGLIELFYGRVNGVDAAMPPPPVSPVWEESPFIIRQSAYRPPDAQRPTMIMTWEQYQRLGPLVIATEHYSRFKDLHLWFSGLSIDLDKRGWTGPEPVDLPKKR